MRLTRPSGTRRGVAEAMRITIIGAGAMGCLFSVLLAGVAEVRLLDRSPAVVAAIAEHGVRLIEARREAAGRPATPSRPFQSLPAAHRRAAGRQRVVRVPIASDPGETAHADLALILVKAGGTAWAGAMARRVLAPGGLALTLQNGLGQRETLAGILGSEQVWQGVTAQGATLLGPGRVRHAGNGPTYLETRPAIAERAGAAAAALRQAGLEVFLVPDLESMIWGKLLVNVGVNALSGLLRVPNGVLAETPAVRQLMARALAEAVQVAKAKGVALPDADPEARLVEVCRATADNRSSLLQDVLRGRPTEIDAINGAIVREARGLALPAPTNELLVNLVKALEATAADRIPCDP